MAPSLTLFEMTEFLSYAVTVVGFPLAVGVFMYENRRERQNEDEEINQRLADQYSDFLKLCLDNADLQLLRRASSGENLTDEQQERKIAVFGILVALFERAYIVVYDHKMSKQTKRLWLSWEDYMREWCRRRDFRAALPALLEGEDEDFARHIFKIAKEEEARAAASR